MVRNWQFLFLLLYQNRPGKTSANTVDVYLGLVTAFSQIIFENCSFSTVSNSSLPYFIPGSYIGFIKYNQVTNDDRVWTPYGFFQRIGDGLTDTRAWNGTNFNGGAGLFALKMTPTNSISLLTWDAYGGQGKLISNLNTKIVHVDCRIKITNANFYAGVHTNPALRVMQGGVQVNNLLAGSNVAGDTIADQQLTVSFTSSSDSRIDIYLDMKTDATGTDADVLVGELNVGLPDGTSIDNTRLTYWSNALPLPPDATIPTPTSFLSVQTSTLTGVGTLGKLLTDYIDAAISTRAVVGSPMTLSNSAIDAILDRAIEGTYTLRQSLEILLAELAGKATGGGTATIVYRNPDDTKDRVILSVDNNGNRSAVVTDFT